MGELPPLAVPTVDLSPPSRTVLFIKEAAQECFEDLNIAFQELKIPCAVCVGCVGVGAVNIIIGVTNPHLSACCAEIFIRSGACLEVSSCIFCGIIQLGVDQIKTATLAAEINYGSEDGSETSSTMEDVK